jgi:DNA-3-methyladenine glycosylase II
MPVTITVQAVAQGLDHLRAVDPILGDIINRVGPFRMKRRPDRFQALVRAIIFQQISGSAGQSILRRLDQLLQPGKISAENLLRFTPVQLRGAGVSPQKAGYLLDLSQKVFSEEVRLELLGRMTNDEVIAELTKIKGIGIWTAQMFLMFSLRRIDVFPHGDLGIRSALRKLYRLRKLPDEKRSLRIAAPWRPYATIASWYCWRSLDLDKAT